VAGASKQFDADGRITESYAGPLEELMTALRAAAEARGAWEPWGSPWVCG